MGFVIDFYPDMTALPKDVVDYLAKIGRKGGKAGGKARTIAKVRAAKKNGKKGGRPRLRKNGGKVK